MSRHLFLFVSVAFLAGATCYLGGVRPGVIKQAFRTEFRADIVSLKDDAAILRRQPALLRADLLSLWLDARSEAVMLRADADFEARRLAKRLITGETF